jgi:ubiquinone/menaquinone biosynthesis C-methylase UbiE
VPKIYPFDKYPDRYDRWFEKYKYVFKSELDAVRRLLPDAGLGLEIGVGSGRFAAPLGIQIGVEPAREMRRIAVRFGIKVVSACAEELPFNDAQFDFALMETVDFRETNIS